MSEPTPKASIDWMSLRRKTLPLTALLLQVIKELKESNFEFKFEKEHISTISGDGELMLTILALFAQKESKSTIENIM
ncbi:MAG TPA: recombinase family protein [Desulfitobacteriaceae bacterium]|nr:recombinase family protein [Desulfitobacteriaceae bacterium]